MKRNINVGHSLGTAIMLLLASAATAQTVVVSAQCNIYGAGHSSPHSSCNTSIGPGILPVMVPIPAGATLAEFHNVTGTVLYCPTCQPENGPDGNPASAFTIDPLDGIAGLTTVRGRSFEGIFLSNAEPANPAPPTLSILDPTFTELSPLIAQHFFIGDGQTGTASGSTQRFHIPPGATRLFLGFSDGFPPCVGAYSDNSGSISATVVFGPCASILHCCVADVDDGTGQGTPDAGVTIDDLLYYLSLFEAGAVQADLDDGTGTGTPDGGVTIDDLLYYLTRFEAGC